MGSSWGIEREQIFMDEVLESPALLPLIKEESLKEIVDLFDNILSIKKSNLIFEHHKLQYIELQINSIIIENILNFSPTNKILLNDCLEYSLDLFDNKENSRALYFTLLETVR